VPTASGTQSDFNIDQTDVQASQLWGAEYIIQSGGSGCSVAQSRQYGCLGVDIVETNPGSSIQYAIAGAFSEGIFFCCLDAAGAPITSTQLFFPVNAGEINQRPTIRESPSTPGDYYICGNIGGQTFVIRCNTTGGYWANLYTNFPNEARSLIESPYNPAELIVVGRCDPGSFLATEAFFMTLNSGSGAFISMNCYSDGGNGDEWFTSIEQAASTAGGNGFIVGGRVHSLPFTNPGAEPWMIKLDPNGNVIWSTLIQYFTSSTPFEIGDVSERYNALTTPPSYEYFGVAHTPQASSDELTVWKLDDNGSNSIVPNEFNYAIGGTAPTYFNPPTQLDILGDGTNTPGDGLVAFGTDQSSSDHILTKAYFNGIDGCGAQSRWSPVQGPQMTINPTLAEVPFGDCIDFNLIQTSWTTGNPYCSWSNTTVGGGSNVRSNLHASVDKNHTDNMAANIGPNPTNRSVTVDLKKAGEFKITLTNSVGQVVKSIEKNTASSTNGINLDFEALGLSEGMYFINVSDKYETHTTKVIYSK
jgi:hypothetical protein